MGYFLGIDAGGTKTEFVLGDDQRELARVRSGSIKRMRVSAEDAEKHLRAAVMELEQKSGVSMLAITHCCVGAAGNSVPLVREWMLTRLPLVIGGGLTVLNDVEIALDAAFHGGRGILVLAGTGSNIAGRSVDGRLITAGGWGPALADQGSGHSLGHRALRRVFLAIDRQRPTKLMELILARWNLSTQAELVAYANQRPSPDFSQLAPLVAQAAEEGDAVALETIEREAAELAELILLVIERLQKLEGSGHLPPQIAYTGSVITFAHTLRKAVLCLLREKNPAVAMLDAPSDPPLGALWRARHLANQSEKISQ